MTARPINFLMITLILLIFAGCVNIERSFEDEWKSVATGYNHTCAIDISNDLYCWGKNIFGQLGDGTTNDSYKPKLVNDKKWDSISAGENLTCGITTDKDLFCWGVNYSGGTGTGSEEDYLTSPGKVGSMKWKSVKVLPVYHHTVCGITADDELYCWGLNYSVKFVDISEDSYYSRVPQKAGDYNWKKIEIGRSSGCGINLDNELWCWGQDQYPVIDTESENVDLPQKVNDEKWLDISIYNELYANHTCAIRSDSTLFCWGGIGSTSIFENNISMINYGKGWRSAHAGKDDICAIKEDDSLYCFGEHVGGKFYNGGPELTYNPIKVSSNKWKSLSSGYGFKCGVRKDGHLFCWGLNDYGQIGNGKLGNRSKPEQIGQDSWENISSGSGYTCGIKDKKLFCWGYNCGQLGDGTEISRQEPVKITDKDWKSVSAYGVTVCAVDGNDKLFCWGDNFNPYSSPEATEQIIIKKPEKVDEEDWLQVSTGRGYVCGIRSGKHIYCWGSNNENQLGYENTDYTQGTTIPHKLDENKWKSVNSHGFYSTCGLRNDGLLFCWGNYLYQCSENQSDQSIRQISEIKWKLFDQNDDIICGITEDDYLYCWGDYNSGRLGIGEVESESIFLSICEPTKVGNKKWKDVSTGRSTTCGIDIDRDLYCWGLNDYGIIGIDKDAENTYYADTPQKVGNRKWTEVSVGYNNVCALDENEKLFCWGSNNYGQLGNGMAWEENMYEVVSY